jgi:hypothetical protein
MRRIARILLTCLFKIGIIWNDKLRLFMHSAADSILTAYYMKKVRQEVTSSTDKGDTENESLFRKTEVRRKTAKDQNSGACD